MASKIDDITDHIEDKATQIAPELRQLVEEILQHLHLGLAEKMTEAALTQVKKFLAGNISIDELAGSALAGVSTILHGFLGKDEPQPMVDQNGDGIPDPTGATGLLSNKLTSGLIHIRRGARGDFRAFLSKIEEMIFNSLPDNLKGPLSKIFGGNPFDANANNGPAQPQQQESGGIFGEIGEKIHEILDRIQNALRDRVLEIVSGGHRRLEDKVRFALLVLAISD